VKGEGEGVVVRGVVCTFPYQIFPSLAPAVTANCTNAHLALDKELLTIFFVLANKNTEHIVSALLNNLAWFSSSCEIYDGMLIIRFLTSFPN
jgi:hypothetical protein